MTFSLQVRLTAETHALVTSWSVYRTVSSSTPSEGNWAGSRNFSASFEIYLRACSLKCQSTAIKALEIFAPYTDVTAASIRCSCSTRTSDSSTSANFLVFAPAPLSAWPSFSLSGPASALAYRSLILVGSAAAPRPYKLLSSSGL